MMRRIVWLPLAGILLAACGEPSAPSSSVYVAPGFPQVRNLGGPLLSAMRLTVITVTGDSARDSLFLFARRLPTSTWWQTVSQPYGVTIQSVDTLTGTAPADHTLTASQLETYIRSTIANSPALVPTSNSLYLLILPPGFVFAGNFCGYHSSFTPSVGFWAVVERCGGFQSPLEQLTNLASHEIIEAATDPFGNAWLLASGSPPWSASPWASGDCPGCSYEEVADFCEGTRYVENGFSYQRIYSNGAAAAGADPCVPALAAPYYVAYTDLPWYAPKSGDTIRIPVTGRASGPVNDWFTGGQVMTHGTHAPAWSLIRPNAPATNFPMLNAGISETLRVWFPGGATHGDYAVFLIRSGFTTACDQVPSTSDCYHAWAVGAYVP